MQSVLLDIAGHRRSPATMPGYHRGRPPRNKGEHYPAGPPTVEEIVAVMRTVGDRADGHRLRALIVLLWRAGLPFGQQARAAGIAQSMGSRGDCYDNSVVESFFATLKKELIHRRSWPEKNELRSEIFEYIEVFYG